MLLTMTVLRTSDGSDLPCVAAMGITQAACDVTPETMTWGDTVSISVKELKCEIRGQ